MVPCKWGRQQRKGHGEDMAMVSQVVSLDLKDSTCSAETSQMAVWGQIVQNLAAYQTHRLMV